MTTAEVLERAAEEADLDQDSIERAIAAFTDSINEATERRIRLEFGTGKTHLLADLVLAFVAAEREGTVDESTAATIRAVRNLMAHNDRAQDLIESLLPDHVDIPTPAAVLQARRNAEARTLLLEEFGALRSHEVAELAGSRAANRAALANRWRAENRILAVPLADELLYPGFQFTAEGKPNPAVAPVLGFLRTDPYASDWQTALWFSSPTSWLGGRRPVDLLDDDPDAVTEAARREVSDLAG
jgi:hypothetical protein